MTKQEAINMLNNAVAQLQTTREVHFQLQSAIELLKSEDTPKEQAKTESVD